MTSRASVRSLRPEPGRFWIQQVPSGWPGSEGLWVDVSQRRLGGARTGRVPESVDGRDGALVYLPPVADAQRAAVDSLSARLAESGVPVLRQRQPDEPAVQESPPGVHWVLDLLPLLLAGDEAAWEGLEASNEVAALWPLIPGISVSPSTWEPGLAAVAAAGLCVVVPMALELDPTQRRRLAEFTDDAGYHALFHAAAPDAREFDRAARGRGLATSPPRPVVTATPRLDFHRRVATELILVADLWLRLERPEAAGQNLLRAARWAEDFEHDLRALAREGNLSVVPWLDDNSRGVVIDLAAEQPSALRRDLEDQYLEEA